MPADYDALLVVSFGGPDGPDDVLPFLENVLRGRNVPRERMLEVAEHYYHFGGHSPINDQNRQLIAALETELAAHGPKLPIYWGNRNWHPLLADTLRQMAADGVRRALAFVTTAYSSYSGCRQYRENIARAQQEVGPDRARRRQAARVLQSSRLHRADDRARDTRRSPRFRPIAGDCAAHLHRPQHSACRWPTAAATKLQLREACRLVADGVGRQRLAARLSKPQRPAATAVARAGRLRLPARAARNIRRCRRRHRPHRLHFRPPRSAVRPGHRSANSSATSSASTWSAPARSARIRASCA